MEGLETAAARTARPKSHVVHFLIVGAYALAVHRAPRFTGDLDVLIRPIVENAARLLTAVRAFGFPVQGLRPEGLVEPPRRMLQMGVEPVQIRVMTAINSASWEEAWTGHLVAGIGDHEAPFLGRDASLRNKRAAGRLKDLADIEAIARSWKSNEKHRSLRRPRGRDGRNGRNINLAIAACALTHDAALWTLNVDDFTDVPGLSLIGG